MSPTRRTRIAALLAASLTLAVWGLGSPTSHAQDEPGTVEGTRRVVVVSDSIAAGAQGAITDTLERGGWTVVFDAERNRTTYSAAPAVAAHLGELTDTVVLSLGANDGGDPETFRERVDSVMAELGGVRRVFWLNLHEVREFYGPANEVLRAAAADHDQLSVLDWHALADASEELTAADGLHLTAAGGAAMAGLVGAAVLHEEPVEPPTTAPPESPAPTAAPDVQPAAPADTSDPTRSEPGGETAADSSTEPAAAGSSWRRWLGWTVGGFAAFVAALAGAGLVLAVWSLWSTRPPRRRHGTAVAGVALNDAAVIDAAASPAGAPGLADTGRGPRSARHPAVRAQLRAQRIAAAREAAEQQVTER